VGLLSWLGVSQCTHNEHWCTVFRMTFFIEEGIETLDTIAQRRTFALERVEQLTGELIREVQDEAARGTTEVELARRAGVTRRTIRNWLGK
jgi:predicted transcriptional regulator